MAVSGGSWDVNSDAVKTVFMIKAKHCFGRDFLKALFCTANWLYKTAERGVKITEMFTDGINSHLEYLTWFQYNKIFFLKKNQR